MTLRVGANSRTASFAEGSRSARPRFSYTVAEGDLDANGVSIAGSSTFVTLAGGATIKDAAPTPNDANLAFTDGLGDQAGHRVDGVKPTIPAAPAITSNPGSDQTYTGGDAVQATVTFSEAVSVTGTPKLALDVGGTERTANCALKPGDATMLVCSYTLVTADEDSDGIAIGENKLRLGGGTIKDAVGNNAVLAHDELVAQSGHKVAPPADITAPAITAAVFTSSPGGDSYTQGNDIEVT
ncbi:MAG: hypothetical protein OXC31_02920, partial [Spirochaetaceae bacterium]|nr:hypothetical protein [Spirochaetaceae bacterium]